jgi:hypothetical protein
MQQGVRGQSGAGVLIPPERLNSSRRWFLGTFISADYAKSSDPIADDRGPDQAPKTMKHRGNSAKNKEFSFST